MNPLIITSFYEPFHSFVVYLSGNYVEQAHSGMITRYY
ncbi:hypothetical protein Xsze_03190 [Xenorhabdus szentirmaii DSM 16338]|nr:hypothetical protein Xsze_03190 [Xenorhabdus szentirmaii DSM 16338]